MTVTRNRFSSCQNNSKQQDIHKAYMKHKYYVKPKHQRMCMHECVWRLGSGGVHHATAGYRYLSFGPIEKYTMFFVT